MEIPTTDPEVIVTVADPDLVGSDSRVAVTATIGGLGAVAGAVYNPLALMLPQADVTASTARYAPDNQSARTSAHLSCEL